MLEIVIGTGHQHAGPLLRQGVLKNQFGDLGIGIQNFSEQPVVKLTIEDHAGILLGVDDFGHQVLAL
mgnify:CR=1 FL=1